MKIYLLILLIGTLLTAVHFISAPKRQPETLPHQDFVPKLRAQ